MDPEVILDRLRRDDVINSEDRNKILRDLQTEAEVSTNHVFSRLADLPAFRSKKQVLRKFAEISGMEFRDLETSDVTGALTELLDASTVHQYFVFPLERTHGVVKLAVAEPPDLRVTDDLEALLDTEVEFCLADPDRLRDLIDEYYGTSLDDITETLEQLREDATLYAETLEDGEPEASRLEEQAEEGSIIRLVNMIILEAVERDASDIHIEPREDILCVRYRIDGILHDVHRMPTGLQGALISRVKIMAEMDIAERRVPQDGRIKKSFTGRQLDLRVSTLPGNYGESVVLRILDKESVRFGLEELGFLPDHKAIFDQLIRRPHGIILVTGPTGSGKTTTLYSALSEINDTEIKIITIEDPVEYQIEGINQMQVKEEIGLGFAEGLRTLLRQNPDVILVGEIRDHETAETAIRASLTGHLVFATLHTNDAPGAVDRLEDLGVSPYLIGSSVQAIMSQRLVRVICDNCKEVYHPEVSYLEQVGFPLGDADETTFYRGAGCSECDETGYSGRTAIFELLVNNKEVNDEILENGTATDIRRTAVEHGMRPLRQDGFIKVRTGETTLMEVARVTQAHGAVSAV